MLDLSGVWGGGTLSKKRAEQERPYLAAESGKDRAYKAGWLKSHGAGRESERPVIPQAGIPEEGAQDNALEGRGLALIELVRR